MTAPIGHRWETMPIQFRCDTCGGPVRYVLDAPYRLDLDHLQKKTQAPHEPVTYAGTVDRAFVQRLVPTECERCRLDRAITPKEREALVARHAELKAVVTKIGLRQTVPFTVQRNTWQLRGDRADLAGFTATSYGLWHIAPPAGIEFSMRFMCVQIGEGQALLVLYPLEIITHPAIPGALHLRWDPATGREWTEIINERSATVEQLKRLMDGLRLYRVSRPAHRPNGTTTYTVEDVRERLRSFVQSTDDKPTREAFLEAVGIPKPTWDRYMKTWGTNWTSLLRAVTRD